MFQNFSTYRHCLISIAQSYGILMTDPYNILFSQTPLWSPGHFNIMYMILDFELYIMYIFYLFCLFYNEDHMLD